MYRTDKQFMNNPATASCRIYIGGLPKTIVAADLEEKFKMHGKILGLVLQMGFAFVQFENENQAHLAIKHEHGAVMHGRKITVRQALDKSQKGQLQQNNPNQNRRPLLGQAPNQGAPPAPNAQTQPHEKLAPALKSEHQAPPQQQAQAPPDSPVKKPDLERKEPQREPERVQREQIPPLGGPKPPLPGLMDDPKDKPKPRNLKPQRDRFKKPEMYGRDEPYYGREEYPPPTPPYSNRPAVIEQPDRNDCEIIVVSKALTKYAEYIEQRLNSMGLIVDLLFPNDDVPIGRVLANISSRGCLYAILVMPQNEEHRSLTLNVLHGMPQEHRNMPVEDALLLITRNFDSYMRGDKTAAETLGPGGVLSVSDRHPTSMQLLLNLLAENRQITTAQYDRLLKYLQERREVQQKHEIEEGVDQTSQESNSKQAELQNRIMNILNKSSIENPPPPQESSEPSETAPPPLLKDPSVQKALDSLLGGDMFKSIGVAL